MPYAPINIAAYTATYAGAIAGMAVSGWIVDPDKADYSNATIIAGAFAQAFDIAWNNADPLNDLELACMTSVVQQDFTGRGPGPFESLQYKDPTNWNITAVACVALILECDIFFASQGITPPTPPIPPVAGPCGPVTQVLFVDGTLGATGADGSLGAPFPDLQSAVSYAASILTLDYVWLRVAPGIYRDPVVIPPALNIGICAWGAPDNPAVELTGTITSYNPASVIVFKNVWAYMPTITVSDTATYNLIASFYNCDVTANILADNITLILETSSLSGDVTGTSSLALTTDGPSWYYLVESAPTLLPAYYSRTFEDAGHSTFFMALVANGVAIGTTVFIDLTIPSIHVRTNDTAQIQIEEASTDFICGVQRVYTNIVTVWLTNLSRVSTNFLDPAKITFHHENMVILPEVIP